MRDLRTRTSDCEIYTSFLTAEQLRRTINVLPHVAHIIDWEKAAYCAGQNARWATAIRSYDETYAYTRVLLNQLNRSPTYHLVPPEEAVLLMGKRPQPEYPTDWSLETLVDHISYFVDCAVKWDECASASYLER